MMKRLFYLILFLMMVGTALGQYNVNNQPPVTNRPYPNAYYNHRLPNAGTGGPLNHLMPNSANLISTALNGGSILGSGAWHTPGTDDGQAAPLYYGLSTDPNNTLSGCTTWPSANGVTFHGPNGAPYSYATWDSSIMVWDQTNNNMVALYAGTTPGLTLPSGGGTLVAHGGYCSSENRNTGSGYNGGTGASTAGLAPFGDRVRLTEILDVHHINHGLPGQVACDDSNNGLYPSLRVWPATESAGFHGQTCASIGVSSTNRPPNGALIFADYLQSELDCMDPDKASCSGINKLARWQFPFIEAVTFYGITLEETGTGTGIGIKNMGLEGLTSYEWYNTHGFPNHREQDLIDYMAANCQAPTCSLTQRSAPHSLYQWNLSVWAGISVIRGMGIVGHLHVADQCVAIGLQGLASANGVAGCATAGPPPPGLVTLTPTSYDFQNVNTGFPSGVEDFTFTNGTAASVTLSTISFTGTNAALYSQSSTNSCGTLPQTVAVNGLCLIHVVFTPIANGTFPATLSVVDSEGTHTSSLTGTGVAPTAPSTPTGLTATVH